MNVDTSQTAKNTASSDLFDAFARGVASAVGKACWDVMRFDVVRRESNRDLAGAVVLHESGVSTKLRTGAVEFHRLVYVLATFDKTLGALPTQFPCKSALRLGGLRFLAFRQWLISTGTRTSLSFENISREFPLWEFFIANEMTTSFKNWQLLKARADRCKLSDEDKDLGTTLHDAISRLEESATAAIGSYDRSLKDAFGQRFGDRELREKRNPLDKTQVFNLLPWAEMTIRGKADLISWVKNNAHKDHELWLPKS